MSRFFIALFVMVFLSSFAYSEVKNKMMGLLTENAVLDGEKKLPRDQYMGDINAPIVMIEYASFSCIHCAKFSKDILPTIKEKYIDTGKVLFIYRDFPLDRASFKAAQLARCYASKKHCKKEKLSCTQERDYFNMYHALFDSLQSWVSSNTVDKLKEIAKIGKMGDEEFYGCIKDLELQDQILNMQVYAARTLGVNATPVFYINGKGYNGTQDLQFFTDTFDAIIAVSNKKQ